MEKDKLYLVFIELIGVEADGSYRYEFYFNDDTSMKIINDTDYKPIGLNMNWEIISANAKKIISVKTNIKFDLIQNSLCFSFKECMDGCVCLACENIDNYEEYPEDGRLVFSYGQSFDSVEDKLGAKKIFLV